VQPFKKGPDYIDPLWLSLASDRPCYNLDFNTQSRHEIAEMYQHRSNGAAFSLLEGNKGLYDGLELDGSNSNAALAAQLKLPVLLVIDCQGMTRGVAPLVLGYLNFEPKVRIAGIVLNKLGGQRHEGKLRDVLAHYTDVPVIGAVQRHQDLVIDERHLGLVPSNEAKRARAKLALLADHIERQVDLQAVRDIADSAASISAVSGDPETSPETRHPSTDIRIGIARDQAFAFYYQDDLERFRQCGARTVFFDSLSDNGLPDVDGLFLGGGFPETQMDRLASNSRMRADIRNQIEQGLPTYAECGGLMYLSQSIEWQGRCAEMVGTIPARARMHERPVGRGYTRLQATAAMPWKTRKAASDTNSSIRAHEFHHSSLEGLPADQHYAYDVLRGTGIDGDHDGFVYNNLVACYIHQRHTQANPWVARFVDFVRQHKQSNTR